MPEINACGEPFIVHSFGGPIADEDEIPEQTEPHSGYIDPRIESTDGVSAIEGMTYATIRFNRSVYGDASLGPVKVANFQFESIDGAAVPEIVAVTQLDAESRYFEVVWDQPIPLKRWTTLVTNVYNNFGVQIDSEGNLGAGAVEPDRIDIAFLPGDIDQDGQVTPLDLLRFRQGMQSFWEPLIGDLELYLDIDRSGKITPLDLLKLRQLINGVGSATEPWADQSLESAQP